MLSKLIAYTLAFELSAIGLLLIGSHSTALIGSYLLLHAVGSCFAALSLVLLLPARYRQPRLWVLVYLFSFNYLMPLIGLVSVTLGLLLGCWLPQKKQAGKFDTTEALRFSTHRNHEGTGFRGGQVRAQLGNARTPLDQRLKALVAVQDTPARATGYLLSDPADDVRLLAYGILDSKEKQITQRILATRHQLERSENSLEQFSCNKLIAELYWELIYQNLVQGDMRSFSADQVRRYGEAARRINHEDAGLWFLLSRLELFSGRIVAAETALSEAQRRNFARERLLPYWAELRFLQRDFDEVRLLFAELANQSGVPALRQSRAYWLAAQPGDAS